MKQHNDENFLRLLKLGPYENHLNENGKNEQYIVSVKSGDADIFGEDEKEQEQSPEEGA
jgi:hypothetical protein